MAEPKKDRIFIIRYEVRNFLRIVGGIWDLRKGLMVLTSRGRNGQGKTSWITGLRSLFQGAGAVPPDPVHEGAAQDAESVVRAWLSNGWTIERAYTEKNPKGYLRVRSADGLKGNQSSVAPWLTPGVFDPLSFYEQSDLEQTQALISLAAPLEDGSKLADALASLDAEAAEIREAMTDHISAQRRTGKMAPPAGERVQRPDTAADVQVLAGLQEEARRRNGQAMTVRQRETEKAEAEKAAAEAERHLQAAREKVREWEVYAAEMQGTLDRRKEAVEAAAAHLADMPDVSEDIAAVQARMEGAQEQQQAAEAWEQYDADQEAHATAQAAVQTANAALAAIKSQRRAVLDQAVFPVPGLTVADGLLHVNGKRLATAGGRERLMVAARATAAADPTLGVLLIDEATGVDKEGLAELGELADAEDLQVVILRLGSDDPTQPGAEIGDLEVFDGFGPLPDAE